MWIQLVHAAQSAGDFRILYPRGAERITEVPWFLQVAIDQALMILNWQTNLTKTEVPPPHLWEDAEGLNEWWERVEAKRNDGIPTSSRYDGDDDDRPAGGQEMVQNDLARELKGMKRG